MKKQISCLVLAILLVVGVYVTIAKAAEDVVIKITIPGEKVQEYGKYFLLAHPNQTTNAPDPNDRLTDKQWIKYRIFLFAKNAYRNGKRIEFEQMNKPTFDPDIIN